ncbi:MAG: hypothetical protein RR854_00150 [Muribaculaceae bacterium]
MKNDNAKTLRDGIVKANAIKDAHIIGALRAVLSVTIDDAVAKHNYDNQTGNLEGSYGWAIYHNGQMIDVEVKGGGAGATMAYNELETYLSFHDLEGVVIAGAEYADELEEYVRHTDGFLSVSGDKLFVLGKFFDFHSRGFVETLKSIARL